MDADDQIAPGISTKYLSTQDPAKIGRMSTTQNQKKCIIYPEGQYKGYWDLFMTLILVITCILTPYNIAFYSGDEPVGLQWTILIIDFLFLLDIIVIFNTVIFNEEMEIITSRK